jgi:hypothetical protein
MFDNTPLPWQGRHAKTSEEESAMIQKRVRSTALIVKSEGSGKPILSERTVLTKQLKETRVSSKASWIWTNDHAKCWFKPLPPRRPGNGMDDASLALLRVIGERQNPHAGPTANLSWR